MFALHTQGVADIGVLTRAALVAVAGVAAATGCVWRASHSTQERAAWWLLALASLLEISARWVWWTHTASAAPRTGAALHVAAAVLGAAAALQLRAPTPDQAAGRRTVLDGAIVLVAALLTGSKAV